jgi:hypothetical protein
MTPDKFTHIMPPPAKRRGGNPYVLFAGVAGACALGAGLGLWARPAMNERQMAVAAPGDVVKAIKSAAPIRMLQIVVDDGPAPIGTPIEVLSAQAAKPAPVTRPALAPEPEPEPQAPIGPPQGLMRVQPVISPDPTAAPPKPIGFARAAEARVEAAAVAMVAKAEAHRVALAKAVKAERQKQLRLAQVRAEKQEQLRLAEAKAEKQEQVRLDQARAAKQEQLAQARADRQEQLAQAKAEKQEQLRLAQAKAERQEQLRLARAEAKGRAQARAEAKAEALAQAQDDARRRVRLASLVHAGARPSPHASSHTARPASTVALSALDRRPGRKARRQVEVEQATVRKPPRVVVPAYRARPAQVAPQPHPGLMMVSNSPPCADSNCSDPGLSAAGRQVARAYQGARAAGVSDAQLARHQQHWLASRSAAVREAPWAVHDVDLAHIAELNGMAKDAHGDGR